MGTLKNFYRPLGECADRAGDVFIANGNSFLEYAHGGKKPIATLNLSGYAASGCAFDPTTGNLATTWDSRYQGEIAVYPDGKGTPTVYSNGGMFFIDCGYDNAGNLFADGTNPTEFAFAELPKGSGTMQTISLGQYIYHGAAVQWDGKYVAVGDGVTATIYQFTISGSSGTLHGTTSLGGTKGLYWWIIDRNKVIGADDLASTVWYWNYPAGGSPIKSITQGVGAPFDVTISKAPK